MRTFSMTTLIIILAQEGCDGRTDKNRQTIAVTLHLHFAARVNDMAGACGFTTDENINFYGLLAV